MEMVTLRPTVKEIIWGGRKLIDEYGFHADGDNAAEAWLLSCHKDGPSYIQNGPYKGKTLYEALQAEGMGILGTHNAARKDFPILIKLIDARDKLSVQVHPGDEYARRVENENGKTEAWLILDAEEGAELVYGVNREVTREEFAASIEHKTLSALLNRVKVKPGDVVFIPSGMLHAIGAGILLAEVQQSSNTTYRVYDYDRPGKDGKPRELHVKKATDVVELKVPKADFRPSGAALRKEGGTKTLLTFCRFFAMYRVAVDGEYTDAADDTSFVSLLVLEGEGTVANGNTVLRIKKGSSVFLPADSGIYTLEGKMTLLETRT